MHTADERKNISNKQSPKESWTRQISNDSFIIFFYLIVFIKNFKTSENTKMGEEISYVRLWGAKSHSSTQRNYSLNNMICLYNIYHMKHPYFFLKSSAMIIKK